VGLIGPNGAGKTTAFNVITGMNRPTSGHVRYRGEDLTGLPRHEVTRRGLARTFQNIRLFKELSVLENVLVGCHLAINPNVLGKACRGKACRTRTSREGEGVPDKNLPRNPEDGRMLGGGRVAAGPLVDCSGRGVRKERERRSVSRGPR